MQLSLKTHLLLLLKNRRNLATKRCYCPICKSSSYFKEFGIIKRKKAQCPICGSLERHRALYHIYNKDFLNTEKNIKILHTAPEKCISDLIIKKTNIEYYPIDIEPKNFKHINCIKADVTNLQFKDNTFDIVLSNHVMEHIKDEKKFLSELQRVTKINGCIYLSFPIFMNFETTFESDEINTPEDREKYYGQNDHVRRYGRDVIEKLTKSYSAEIMLAPQTFPEQNLGNDIYFKIIKHEKVRNEA